MIRSYMHQAFNQNEAWNQGMKVMSTGQFCFTPAVFSACRKTTAASKAELRRANVAHSGNNFTPTGKTGSEWVCTRTPFGMKFPSERTESDQNLPIDVVYMKHF